MSLFHVVILSCAAFTLAVFFFPASVRLYRVLAAVALIFEGYYIAVRWAGADGHPPIFGTFEEALSASFAVILFGFILDWRGKFSRFTALFAFLTVLYGLKFDSSVKPLVISERSLWVYFHALFAWITYGFYSLSFAAAAYTLARSGPVTGIISKKSGASPAPEHNSKDSLCAMLLGKGLVYGFTAQTAYFILGSYYSSLLHGAWWTWDAVEYLFAASWFIYAAALHGKVFFGWRRITVSYWVAAGYIVTMALYWGLIYSPWITYHIFDTELKTHVFSR